MSLTRLNLSNIQPYHILFSSPRVVLCCRVIALRALEISTCLGSLVLGGHTRFLTERSGIDPGHGGEAHGPQILTDFDKYERCSLLTCPMFCPFVFLTPPFLERRRKGRKTQERNVRSGSTVCSLQLNVTVLTAVTEQRGKTPDVVINVAPSALRHTGTMECT